MNINGLNLQVYRIQRVWAVFGQNGRLRREGGEEKLQDVHRIPKVLG
jgi:hypothetical protein